MKRSWWWMVLPLFACICNYDAPIDPTDPTPLVFEVPKGTTTKSLGPRLLSAGLLRSGMQWTLFGWFGADASCLKAGKFELTRAMTLTEMVATLCGPPLADDVSFAVIEGWRIRDIDKALADRGLIQAGAYTEAATKKTVTTPFPIVAPTLEGYLYPETYKVPMAGVDVEALIVRQLETFQERFLSKHPEGFGQRTLSEIVVVASMLEREEPSPENRPLVAGIIWKRIRIDMPLGIDATTRYPLPDWNDEPAFRARLKDPTDPYNTRRRRGLPPTAIGNPEISSLEAALDPEVTDFLFYLHDAQGNLHPALTNAEHEANRRKFNVF